MIKLAKQTIDVGLATNQIAAHNAFWVDQVGLPFEAELPISDKQSQMRYDALGSVVKINGFVGTLLPGAVGGYRELLLVRQGLAEPVRLQGPDSVFVSLVPPGYSGIDQIGMRLTVSRLKAHRDFYREALCLTEEDPACFRIGKSLLILEEDCSIDPEEPKRETGWRYITLQVFKAAEAHAHALACGATVAKPLTTMRDVARYSIIRDPDGNAVELSQRVLLTGSLD